MAKIEWTDENKKLLKSIVAMGKNDREPTADELRLFALVVDRTELDPFARQIYAIMRKGRLSIETSIDGFRLIAHRSGEYAGQEGPFWCGDDSKWVDVWLAKTPPKAAKVIVHRKGFATGLSRVALWDEYAQNVNNDWSTWKKMPAHLLAKCAEALSLRAAFPQELSGLYTSEEMDQPSHDPLAEIKDLFAEALIPEIDPDGNDARSLSGANKGGSTPRKAANGTKPQGEPVEPPKTSPTQTLKSNEALRKAFNALGGKIYDKGWETFKKEILCKKAGVSTSNDLTVGKVKEYMKSMEEAWGKVRDEAKAVLEEKDLPAADIEWFVMGAGYDLDDDQKGVGIELLNLMSKDQLNRLIEGLQETADPA